MKNMAFTILIIGSLGATGTTAQDVLPYAGSGIQAGGMYYAHGMDQHPALDGLSSGQYGTYLGFDDILEALSDKISERLNDLLAVELERELQQQAQSTASSEGNVVSAN